MTVVCRFADADLLRCRFAISPLMETADALRSLALPGREGAHLPWQREVRPRLPGLGLESLLALLALRGYQPDFLAPAPIGPFTEIGTELARLRATPASRVAAELALALDGSPAGPALRRQRPELSADPGRVRDLLADQLERAWLELVAPWWPRLRDILDADLTFRARQLANAGVTATLGDLDPKIRWREGALEADLSAREERWCSAALILVPSVFVWPRVAVMYDPPAVIYPARGIARLWESHRAPPGAVAALVGPTRARLLTALAEPATTSGLAARCGVAASTVSEHVAVLRAAGLVTSRRSGRSVRHERTALGVALAAPGPATVSR